MSIDACSKDPSAAGQRLPRIDYLFASSHPYIDIRNTSLWQVTKWDANILAGVFHSIIHLHPLCLLLVSLVVESPEKLSREYPSIERRWEPNLSRLDSSLYLSERILFPLLSTTFGSHDYMAIRRMHLLLSKNFPGRIVVSSRSSSCQSGSLSALLYYSSCRKWFWRSFIDVRGACWRTNVNWARLQKQCSTPWCSFHWLFSR